MENKEIYDSDIEIVTDFIKSSIMFDNKNITQDRAKEILQLQQGLLEILPVAQSNRMEAIYKMLNDLYRINNEQYETRFPIVPNINNVGSEIVQESIPNRSNSSNGYSSNSCGCGT